MIIRLPCPKKGNRDVDEWRMVFAWFCNCCGKQWRMDEEDDKPEFCPYCGKERQ